MVRHACSTLSHSPKLMVYAGTTCPPTSNPSSSIEHLPSSPYPSVRMTRSTAVTSHDEMIAHIQVRPSPARFLHLLTTCIDTDTFSSIATGNLPSNLSFLLSSWFADPQELPHIAFGPGGSFFFQSSALAAWEHLPRHLDTLLNELRESRGIAIPARSLSIGENGSFVFLTGADGEIPVWNDIDAELAHRLSGDEERITVEVNIPPPPPAYYGVKQ